MPFGTFTVVDKIIDNNDNIVVDVDKLCTNIKHVSNRFCIYLNDACLQNVKNIIYRYVD